jgi:hypothetical protein
VSEANLATNYKPSDRTKQHLIDTLVQLRLDKEIVEKAERAFPRGLPEVFVLNARRNVESSQDAVSRAVKALRERGMPASDIQALHQEADKIASKGKR